MWDARCLHHSSQPPPLCLNRSSKDPLEASNKQVLALLLWFLVSIEPAAIVEVDGIQIDPFGSLEEDLSDDVEYDDEGHADVVGPEIFCVGRASERPYRKVELDDD